LSVIYQAVFGWVSIYILCLMHLVLSDGVTREEDGTVCVTLCSDIRPNYLTKEACWGGRKNVPHILDVGTAWW
jgi:hypothetical protein